MTKEDAPDLTDQHIGSRIRSRRGEVNITQHELAQALSISFQQVQKYETGKNRVSASRLYRISRILNCPIDYFFEGIDSLDAGLTAANEDVYGGMSDGPQAILKSKVQRSVKETNHLINLYYSVDDRKKRQHLSKVIADMVKTLSA